MNIKNIKKLIGLTIASGALALTAYAGCGEDELANKLKNSPKPQDEIINTNYDAGSMIPDFGVKDSGIVTDSGIKQDAGDGGQPSQDSGFDSGYNDAGLADIYSWDAGFEDTANDAGSSDIDYADAYTFDGEFPDTQAEDASGLEDVLDAAQADGSVELDGAIITDGGLEDGSLDSGSLDGAIGCTSKASVSTQPDYKLRPDECIQVVSQVSGASACDYCVGDIEQDPCNGYLGAFTVPVKNGECSFELCGYELPGTGSYLGKVRAVDEDGCEVSSLFNLEVTE